MRGTHGGDQAVEGARRQGGASAARLRIEHAAASPPGRRKKTVLPLWAGLEQELGQAGKLGKALPFLFSVFLSLF